MRAAAKDVGVDPAAVYRHYKDKQGLLEQVAVDAFVELANEMEAAMSSARKPVRRFVAVGRAYVRYALREPELFRVMFSQQVSPAAVAAVAPQGRAPSQILQEVLVEMYDAGDCDIKPEKMEMPSWSAVHGLAHLAIAGKVQDIDKSLKEVLDATVRSLTAR